MADSLSCHHPNCYNTWSKSYYYNGKCDKCLTHFCKDHMNINYTEYYGDYHDDDIIPMSYCDKCYKEIFNDLLLKDQ